VAATKKYSLEPLVTLREDESRTATKTLADAIQSREGAEHATRSAEERIRRAEEDARAQREQETEKLVRGDLTAADLVRAVAWDAKVAIEHARLAADVERVTSELHDARAAEVDARSDMSARRADLEIVEKHRDAWRDRARRDAETREEDEAAEAWRPKGG
jgi:hypothetical protein